MVASSPEIPADSGICAHCREPGRLRPLTPSLRRCAGCGFLEPAARVPAPTLASPRLPELPGIAPGGLLRGKYRLIARLGEGAHGVSFLAEHEFVSHPVVVKILPYKTGESTDAAVRRLRHEARAGFRVHDPNVVRVLDCDVVSGVWYFVMEYIEGVNLATIVTEDQRVGWAQAVELAADAARGLAAIHIAGLLHRDIKPGNLLLGSDGRLRVADLGVAGLAHERLDASPVAGTGLAGTLFYTAPEVFRADAPIGPAADLYSLGATLFHLMTGRLPNSGDKVFQRLIDLQCRPAAWPADGPVDVPAWFQDLILSLLAIEPHERPASAEVLLSRLQIPARPRLALVRRDEPADELEPRGLGVLPFENENATADDDWLGYAVANFMSQALAELPGIYVVDSDALVAMLGRADALDEVSPAQRLREAGRLVGAGTLLTGRFSRSGSRLRISSAALRSGDPEPRTLADVEGALADLPSLERTLLDRLVSELGLGSAAPPGPRGATLEARESFTLGKQAFLRGEYDHAIALGERALAEAPDFIDAIGFVGVCLARLGRYEAAEARHRQLLELAEQRQDGRRKIEALANLGVMNYYRGEYARAEAFYTEAAGLADQLNLSTEHAKISNNLGFVLFRLERPEQAAAAFLRAIETHRAYGGLTSLVGPYNGMGNVLAEQHRYAEARGYYARALALAEEVGDRTAVGTTHMHLGRCAAQEGRFADAKHEFTMAVNALEETRFWNGLARAYEYIAELHTQLADFAEAVRCAEKRIELARQHANVRMESAGWLQKADALRRAGRSTEADECTAQARRLEVALV